MRTLSSPLFSIQYTKTEVIFITKLISYDNYNSFSGCDVVVSAQMAPINDGAAMKTHVLGSLQTISYSTHQDRAPVRSIGNINAKDYVQGQRTIAGTMVFAMFHEHWMTPLLEELANYVSNTDIWSDELPAINLTISMANEYGYKSNMAIYGVKFIDDGGVMSINDLYTENTLQYVATGIQPLKTSGRYEHSYNVKVSPFKISEYTTNQRAWSWSGIQNYEKQWTREAREINIDNSTMTPLRYAFDPSVYINEPIVKSDDFVLNIYANGDRDNTITNIYLTDTGTGNIYDALNDSVNNIWVVEVPQGEYQIGIKDSFGNSVDDVKNIKVSYTLPRSLADDYPVIIEVGDTNVKVLPNNNSHDSISIREMIEGTMDNMFEDSFTDNVRTYDIASHTYIGQSNSKEALIENLKPNTKYNLYTFNSESNEKSKSITFKTFNSQEYGIELLKEYIINNADLLLSKGLTDYQFDDAEYEYDNIIDSLLELPDSDEKTELLFYAVKLQNELNNLFNESGNYNSISLDRTTPLLNKFNVNDSVSSLVIYKRNKNRNYYVTKTSASSNYQYNGKYNVRYFVQPILEDNKKSCRNDFICFTKEQREILEKYNNVDTLSKLSFINYDPTYDKYNNDLKAAIKAANNLTLYKKLLPAPYAKFYNGTLIADVNYSEYRIKDHYYLCIALPTDALDYTPIRKIKITNEDDLLQLDRYRTGILKDSYYLLWIQDENFNNISPAFILSTYKEDIDIQDYYYNMCSKLIKSIKSGLSGSVYSTYLDTLMLNILAEEEVKYKDLEYYTIQSLLALYGDQLTPYVLDDMTINIVDAISKNHNIKTRAVRNGDNISFLSNASSTYISCIVISDNKIVKNSYEDSYNIYNYDYGYTILFLTDSVNSYKSGYILINNATKEVYKSNIELEMIKNGR